MAITTSSCLKLTPPSQSSSPFTLKPKPTQVTWPQKDRSWRRQLVTGVACILIGLEMANLVVASQDDAVAGDMQLAAVESKAKVRRWSDKRACPPWRVNSLENIVPENLPRPSAHRRWEAVGYVETAPRIKVVAKYGSDCFSL